MLAKVKACRLCLVFCGTYKRLLLNRTHHCTAPQPLYGEKSLRRSVALWVESKTGASWQVACSSCAASAIGDKNIAVPRKQKQKKKEGRNTQQEEEAEIVAYLQGLPDETQVKVVRAPRDCGRF